MTAGRRGFHAKLDEKEVLFLANFYAADSPTKGKGKDSALAAGYSRSTAETKWPRILKKYEDCSFSSSAKAVGINKPYLAMKLKQIMEKGGDKEILAAIRLALANFGEATDQQAGTVVNATGPVMMIVGATPERMRALRTQTTLPTRKELEEQSNERGAARLQMLKEGKLPPLRKNGKYIYRETIDVEASNVPDEQGGDAGGNSEAETGEG